MEMEIEKVNGVKEVTTFVDGDDSRRDESGTITRGTMMKTKTGTASHKGGSLCACADLRQKPNNEPLQN